MSVSFLVTVPETLSVSASASVSFCVPLHVASVGSGICAHPSFVYHILLQKYAETKKLRDLEKQMQELEDSWMCKVFLSPNVLTKTPIEAQCTFMETFSVFFLRRMIDENGGGG